MKFTKKALKEIKKDMNRLERRVVNDLLATGLDTKDLYKHMEDIQKYGCQSGCVSSLIYYNDTVRFFNNYREEILEMASNLMYDCGYNHIEFNNGIIVYNKQKRFTDKEKNIMSWFAYEEIIFDLLNKFEE